MLSSIRVWFFFFNDTATTEIYTLSLHDALPICILPLYTPLGGSWLNMAESVQRILVRRALGGQHPRSAQEVMAWLRSEEHTSELQSRQYLVCRLLLEKKKNHTIYTRHSPTRSTS